MKLGLLAILLFAGCIFAGTGCKPKHNDTVTGGGKGGNAKIIARAEHAGTLLDTAVIYIKYATLDAPENGVYDDSLKVAPNSNGVFANLNTGRYYLYAIAIHNPYNPNTVTGGRSWIIQGNTNTDTVSLGTYQENTIAYPSWGW